MMHPRFLPVTLILSALSGPVWAASSDWIENGPNRLRLVIAEPRAGESTIRGALDIDLAPGWKTYWKDPGDAGVPLQFTIGGSDNVVDARPEFPLPGRHDDGVTVWAGYDGPVQIPIVMTRLDPAKPGLVKANVFLGVCDQICVPVQAGFTVAFGSEAASTADDFLVDQAFARLPEPASADNGAISATVDGDTLVVSTRMNQGAAKDLFLAAPAGWQFAAPKQTGGDAATSAFSAKILLKPQDTPKEPVRFDYTLTNGKKSVSGSAEFSPG